MLFRRFTVLGAIILLIRQISYAQETKPVAPVEKPAASPVKPKATPTPTEPPITFNSVHVDGPYIALTFDDGPNATLNPKLLDLLAAKHLKATFFVVGQNAADHPEKAQRGQS
jgi:peptidoglycan/xylan/chitin deacetylase (PgdA/CDA1 family)